MPGRKVAVFFLDQTSITRTMIFRPLCAALLLTALSALAQQFDPEAVKEVKATAEAMMVPQRASEVKASDAEYGREVMETLASLLRCDPDLAVRFFLKARAQVAEDRKAGTVSQGEALLSDGDRKRSVSVLGAALGGALQRVEKLTPDGDERLPAMIAAVGAMLATDEGCGVESCFSVGTHLGGLLIKAGMTPGEGGTFTVQRLVEKIGPVFKAEWLPALFGPARGAMWSTGTRSDPKAQGWLEQQSKDGAHRELAMLLLAGARISSQEHDAANKQRAGIMVREQLPAEQQWLMTLLEGKSLTLAMKVSLAAEILRVWPTAEPPLRYACAHAQAIAWMADVPVNEQESGRIVESLTLLSVNHALPQDEGMKAAVDALLVAGMTRMERGRALYGWPAPDCRGTAGPELLKLATGAKRDDLAQKLFVLLRTEAAKDASLSAPVRVSELLQGVRLHIYAQQLIDSITEEQIKSEKVPYDLRKHIANKRVHIPIEVAGAAGGLEAALKATVTVLNEKTNEPAAWFGAAWAWQNMGNELRKEGNAEEALRRHCVACVLARAADKFAGETFGHHSPPAEGACRDELKILDIDPRRISVFRTEKGVTALLAEFDGAWKPLSALARRRLLSGAGEE
jgi:hypothetical protein